MFNPKAVPQGLTREGLLEKFFRYLEVDTRANSANPSTPSSPGQIELGKLLCRELKALGLKEVSQSEHGYVYAKVPGQHCPATTPCVGFIAHLDTAPDAPGKPTPPAIVREYDGGDITLKNGLTIARDRFPEMGAYLGQDLVVGDGIALLGADDKAGIAAIMGALEARLKDSVTPYPPIAIAFTVDEELGRGAELFDLEQFGATFAYTVDGGRIGELQYENFNAARVTVSCEGVNVHPGGAKGRMRNALNMAHAFHSLMPALSRPETTEGREGFIHLYSVEGEVSTAKLCYIVREHDAQRFDALLTLMQDAARRLNTEYRQECVSLTLEPQYRNMLEALQTHPEVVSHVRAALQSCGISPIEEPIRGGTDGATLSWRGLPCPNIFAGGHNFHSPYEFLPVDSLLAAATVVLLIARRVAQAQ